MNAKAAKLIEVAYSQIGSPYVFGAWGQMCSVEVRDKYINCSPTHKSDIVNGCQRLNKTKAPSCVGCKYEGKRAFDCRGFTKWCLEKSDIIVIKGDGATEQYNTAANWSQKGEIKLMPDVPCILFQFRSGRMQHTGVYVGNGKVVHASTGVIESAVTSAWTHYAVPKGMYTTKELQDVYMLMVEITKVGNIRAGDWSKSSKVRAAVVGDRYKYAGTSAQSGYYAFCDGKRCLWIPSKYAKLCNVKK